MSWFSSSGQELERPVVPKDTKYVPLVQQEYCSAPACISMVMLRRGIPLIPQVKSLSFGFVRHFPSALVLSLLFVLSAFLAAVLEVPVRLLFAVTLHCAPFSAPFEFEPGLRSSLGMPWVSLSPSTKRSPADFSTVALPAFLR